MALALRLSLYAFAGTLAGAIVIAGMMVCLLVWSHI
jgi:hypothetical protein